MASFGDYNRVNTNVTAMDAQLSLNKINRDLGESRLRLSTGFKINNAEDDAAGFAIATKLKSRVAGLEQALQNVSDAKSVLGIAEASYNSVVDNLIEMKSLATQGSNETLGSDERGYIADQIEALSEDISDIAKETKYNGITLLDSASSALTSTSQNLTFQVGEGNTDTYQVTLNDVDISTLFGTAGGTLADKLLGDSSDGGDPAADASGGTDAEAHSLAVLGASGNVAQGGSIYTDVSDESNRGKIVIDNETVLADDFRNFISHVDTAITSMNSNLNQIGIDQRSLSNKEVNLTEAITANSAARSRIMDTDFAREQSNSIRLQILQQTATAALSQANMGPQAVLGFLG